MQVIETMDPQMIFSKDWKRNNFQENTLLVENLTEKYKAALSYLRMRDHEKFWLILRFFITKEIIWRVKIVQHSALKSNNIPNIKNSLIIWKFGLYNSFFVRLLQKLSNKIIHLYEEALYFSKVNSFGAKTVDQKVDKVSQFYIEKFNSISVPNVLKDNKFIDKYINIIEDCIKIGKNIESG